ncbi:MAG: propionyl-CoA synthetase [Myxococcales bacterium]
MTGIKELRERSLREPEAFWLEAAQVLDWERAPRQALDASNPPFYRWFPDATLNTCHNALDRHVERGRGEQLALIHDSPVTGQINKFTFRELRDLTARFAGVLAGQGVTRGDRVIIYMPMIPETVIAMLACARLGAVHSVVFGGFAAPELATRIDDAQPKVIVAASCGIEAQRVVPYKPLVDAAIALAKHKPARCIVKQRPQCVASLEAGRDLAWDDEMKVATPHACVAVQATDPLYILYTSGTTGQPKGVVRDNGGHAVALAWSMQHVYGVAPGEVFWAASDVGWVVGHSYIVYGPLLHGNTTVLFEGKPVGTPDAGAFWRVIEAHGVCTFFTAPTAFRAIKKEDPEGKLLHKYGRSKLRALFLAGERSDPATLAWAEQQLHVPVVDHYWQTESGWPMVANCLGIERLPVKHGSPTVAVPGYDLRVLDDQANEVPAGTMGALALKLPLPPGTLPTLWNAEQRFVDAYLKEFPGFYKTADAGYVDEEGYVYVMARTDDIINVAGHRLSTGAMEEVLASHPAVAECAVFGVADELKGELPLGLCVLRDGSSHTPEQAMREVVELVRQAIGPVASFKLVTVVKRLPKTRSGKILRSTMKHIADGEPYKTPATIEDPAVLDEIAQALAGLGYAKARAGL